MVFFSRERDLGVGYSPGGPGVVCVCVSENIARATGDTLSYDSVFHRSSPLIRIKGGTRPAAAIILLIMRLIEVWM